MPKIRMSDIHPDQEILEQMALASDAPRRSDGSVDRERLVETFYRELPKAWKAMLRQLPTEEEYRQGKRAPWDRR
jgi:hypothetical protein